MSSVPTGSRCVNRFGIFPDAVFDFYSIVFARLLPLRLFGADFNPAPVIEHSHFHDPLFVIGRPFAFDFLALLHRRNIILPDHDCFATLLFAAAEAD